MIEIINEMNTFYRMITVFAGVVLFATCTTRPATTGIVNADDDTGQGQPLDTITLAMTGDVMMGNIYPHERLPRDSARHLFDDVAPTLQAADITLGNLEGTFAYHGRNRKNPNSKMAFMFMMPPHFVKRLVEAGYDFMGLANNHIYDFWTEAMVSTEQTLQQAGIAYAGSHDPTGKHQSPEYAVLKVRNVTIGLCAFSHENYTLRLQDTATVHRIIAHLDSVCDLVVVSMHAGAEGSAARHLPDQTEYLQGDDRGHLRVFTHLCVDWGADVVYGHGPHVCRAMELYKDRFIAYSLGNFCTCGMGIAGVTGYAPIAVVRVDSQGRFVDGRIESYLQRYMEGPRRDPDHHAAREIATLTREDFAHPLIDISSHGVISRR